MKLYYEDQAAGIELWHGDSSEYLEETPIGEDTIFDALVTDPPYGIVNQFGENFSKDRGGTRTMNFDWDTPEITVKVLAILKSALDRVHVEGSVFCFCGADQFGQVLDAVRAADGPMPFTAKPAMWLKQCPPPAGKGNWWPSGFEMAVYAYRQGAYFGDGDRKRCNVFHYDSYRHGQPGKVDHPTQKPYALMERIVDSVVEPGGMLFDPFAGSGTTLVAARNTGRRAVGVEREEKYCEIIADRLRQGQLFGARSGS